MATTGTASRRSWKARQQAAESALVGRRAVFATLGKGALAGTMAAGFPAAAAQAQTFDDRATVAAWWPVYQHDARQTGRSPVTGPQTAALRWSALPATPLFRLNSAPTVGSDGTVYVRGQLLKCLDVACVNRGYLFALAPDTGTTRWTFPGPFPAQDEFPSFGATTAGAVGTGGMTYVGTDSRLFAMDSAGQPRLKSADIGTTGYITVSTDGLVYADAGDGNLNAYTSLLTHRHAYPVAGGVGGVPTIAGDGAVYVPSQDGYLHAFSRTGLQQWQFRAPGVEGPALGWGGTLALFAGSDNGLYAWLPSGILKWRFPAQPVVGAYTTPALGWDSKLYVGAADGAVTALEATFGRPRWRYLSSSPISVPPVVGGDGTVYVATTSGVIHALSAEGVPRWTFSAGAGITHAMALCPDGTLYVVADRLYAIGPGPGVVRKDVWL
jgi:outer membrane protein assembly factor BamB